MHESAARILDDIEGALAAPRHDDIVKQALRAQFLIEHGHVSQEEAHAVIWRAIESSDYLTTHNRREVKRALKWAEETVSASVIAGEDVDELAGEMELEWALDAFEDEEGTRPPKAVPDRSSTAPPALSGRLLTVDQLGPRKRLDWWVKNWLPKGQLVVLIGDGGVGKGLLSISLTKDVVEADGRVLWLSTEDEPEELRDRMVACGLPAPGDRVLIGENFRPSDVRTLIAQNDIDVLFLDAGRDFMEKPAGGSNNDDSSVRPGLLTLRAIAKDTNTTIVFIHHTTKSTLRADGTRKSSRESSLGSDAYNNVPRLVLHLARNADGELAVGRGKANRMEQDVMCPVRVRPFEPTDKATLDTIVDADEDGLVYMERDNVWVPGWDEWLSAKSESEGPINRDAEVLALLRTYPKGAIPGVDRLHAVHGEDTKISRRQFTASMARFEAAGTIKYLGTKVKAWELTAPTDS